jgi:hypothetical protein
MSHAGLMRNSITQLQTRMEIPNKMTYFKNVQSKMILWLNGPDYTDIGRTYLIQCCNFHGCMGAPANRSMHHWCQNNAMAATKEFLKGKKG